MEDIGKNSHSYSPLILTKASRYEMEKKSVLTKQCRENDVPYFEGWN